MRFFIKRVDRMAKIGYDNRNDTFKARDGGNRVKRIMLIVSYDGTAYHGWQVQPSAITIEGVLNEAVFDTNSRIPGEKFSYALNQRLPEDIVIQYSKEVAADFHPRHCDCRKTYEYTIINRTFPLPGYRNSAYFYYGKLDVLKMRQAAKAFIGEHDFAGFCSAGAQVKTTVREIYSLDIIEDGFDGRIRMRVCGNGFLYNMVRIIAGTLLEVGKGMIMPEDLPEIIISCDRGLAGATAPAKGLCLIEIAYQG